MKERTLLAVNVVVHKTFIVTDSMSDDDLRAFGSQIVDELANSDSITLTNTTLKRENVIRKLDVRREQLGLN